MNGELTEMITMNSLLSIANSDFVELQTMKYFNVEMQMNNRRNNNVKWFDQFKSS